MATEYIVLGNYEGLWEEAGRFTASSPNGAIRACKGLGSLPERIDRADVFVAVPSRSWKPVTVQVETKTALKFS